MKRYWNGERMVWKRDGYQESAILYTGDEERIVASVV